VEELVYLLKVAANAEQEVARRLDLSQSPTHVRVSTLAQLSNYGYPAGAEGGLLRIDNEGIVVGIDGQPEVPRAFVPWSNIAYIADGADLSEKS